MAKKPALKAPVVEAAPAVIENDATDTPVVETAAPAEPEGHENVDYHTPLVSAALTVDTKFHAGQHPKETADQYLRRLLKVVGSSDDAVFDAMPAGSQEWFNTMINEYINKQISPLPVNSLPGFVPLSAASPQAKSSPAAKPDAKSAAKAPADSKGPKVPGIVELGRKLVCENRHLDFQAAAALAIQRGMQINESTFRAVHTDTHGTLKVLVDMGLLPHVEMIKTAKPAK